VIKLVHSYKNDSHSVRSANADMHFDFEYMGGAAAGATGHGGHGPSKMACIFVSSSSIKLV